VREFRERCNLGHGHLCADLPHEFGLSIDSIRPKKMLNFHHQLVNGRIACREAIQRAKEFQSTLESLGPRSARPGIDKIKVRDVPRCVNQQ